MQWTNAENPIHTKDQTGMWECPDFYPVAQESIDGSDTDQNVKYVLKVSLDDTRYEYYTIGTYIRENGRYIPDNTSVDGWAGLRYDYGNFYASKTFFDPLKNRRILWGWAYESDTRDNDVEKGWAGIQLIPRKIWLEPHGKQLTLWPIEEPEGLRDNKVNIVKQNLSMGDQIEVKGITAAQADVEVTFTFKNLDKAESLDSEWVNLHAEAICNIMRSNVTGGVLELDHSGY